MTLYLLHFSEPLQHARHYLGFCEAEDPSERVAQHLAGRGSPLVKAAISRGIGVTLAIVLPGDRNFERRVKNRGSLCRWCPECGVNHKPIPVYDPTAPLTKRMKRYGRGGAVKRSRS